MSRLRQCLFCFAASAVLAMLTWVPLGPLDVFEFKTVDVRIWVRERLRAPAPRDHVQTVLLDDAMLLQNIESTELERLPARWFRSLGTDSRGRLRTLGVELPTWHSVATPLLEDVLAGWWAPSPAPGTPVVVGLHYGAQPQGRDSALPLLQVAALRDPTDTPANVRVGGIDLGGDHDGVVRRVSLVRNVDGRLLPSFVLQLVCAYDGVDVRDVQVRWGRDLRLRRGNDVVRSIPIDAQGRMIVNYRRRPADAETAARDLLARQHIAPAASVVLLGSSARQVASFHNVPVGGREPEVIVAAEALETILSGHYIRRAGRAAQFFLVWAFLLAGSLGMVSLQSWRSVALGFALVVLYFVVEKLVFVWFDVWLDVVLPVAALSWAAAVFPVYGSRQRSKMHVDEMRLLRRFDDLVLMNIANGLVVANRHGVVVKHNPRASQLLGLPGEALYGRHVRELFAMSPATLELLGQVMGAHPQRDLTLPVATRVSMPSGMDVGERIFELGVSLVDPKLLTSESHDDFPCYVLTFDDVSKAVQEAHEDARRARLAAMGEIAAKLGHEIRNSLGGLRLFMENVRDEIPPASAGGRSIDAAIREIQSLYRKIEELRQYGMDPRLELSACDLKDLLEEALAYSNHKLSEKNVRVVLECDRDMPPVRVDRRQLREAFQNLINNAIEAAPEGGRVSIVAQRRSAGNGNAADTYEVRVEDNGPGIADDVREHVFSLFFTTKPDIGTGLGLPIVKKIVESHGGSVSFACNSNGTVFKVILPVRRGLQEVES